MQRTAEGSVFGTVRLFFVCAWNISGTDERIRAKFTRKMCLVPCLDELEDQGQRSRSMAEVTMDKKRHFSALSAACVWFMFGKTSLASSSRRQSLAVSGTGFLSSFASPNQRCQRNSKHDPNHQLASSFRHSPPDAWGKWHGHPHPLMPLPSQKKKTFGDNYSTMDVLSVTQEHFQSTEANWEHQRQPAKMYTGTYHLLIYTGSLTPVSHTLPVAAAETTAAVVIVVLYQMLFMRRKLYRSCVRSCMLHGSEKWQVNLTTTFKQTWLDLKENELTLQRAEMRMIRWMCGTKVTDRFTCCELREGLGTDYIIKAVQWHTLRCYRQEDENDWLKMHDYETKAVRPRCRP